MFRSQWDHWWINEEKNIGENAGGIYISQMDCPGDIKSAFHKGGNDDEISGNLKTSFSKFFSIKDQSTSDIKIMKIQVTVQTLTTTPGQGLEKNGRKMWQAGLLAVSCAGAGWGVPTGPGTMRMLAVGH